MKFTKYLKEDTEDEGGKVSDSIIDFFADFKGAVDDDDIHKFAESKGIDPHEFEEVIYSLVSAFWAQGRSKGFKGEYKESELAMGRDVEMEHTNDVRMAERIAKDHLAELPDYYTRLKKMEEEGKKELGIKD
jgi:hypothetical protein